LSSLFKEEEQIFLTELNSLLPFASISTAVKDPFGYCRTSESIEALTGYKQKDFEERNITIFSIIYHDDLISFEKEYKKAIRYKKQKSRVKDFRINKSDDNLIYVSAYIFINDDTVTVLLSDVSEYYDKLENTNNIINRYNKLMITLNEAIWDWNVKTDEVYYSHRWFEILGYEDNELEQTFDDWKKSIHPDDLEQVTKDIKRHFDDETSIYESLYRLKKKNGDYIWIRDRAIKELDSNGEIERMIGSLRDITDEKHNRENLEKMIITDEMTGLFNRRHYDEQINDEMLRAERYTSELSILMIDIDLFKQVNDTYGHRAGDLALIELARVIRKKIRNTDSAYRIGGEEFVVIAPATSLKNAEKAAERLRHAASSINIKTKYGNFGLTISLGITTFEKGDTYFTLNERADIALYKSKDSGRNCTSICTTN